MIEVRDRLVKLVEPGLEIDREDPCLSDDLDDVLESIAVGLCWCWEGLSVVWIDVVSGWKGGRGRWRRRVQDGMRPFLFYP